MRRAMAVLPLLLLTPACGARSQLFGPDADAGIGPDGAIATGDGAAGCGAGSHVEAGTVARTPGMPQVFAGSVIDPDDDVLIVVGGLSADGVSAQAISTIALGTGTQTKLTPTGDTGVTLGATTVALWDAANHRAIVLGGGNFTEPQSDLAQVFAIQVQGTSAKLTKLPDFPPGTTGDLALAAIYDPVVGRVLAIPESASDPVAVRTYALDLTPGTERWSVLDRDPQPALQQMEFYTAGYDPAQRRMLAVGVVFPSSSDGGREVPGLWALSLDAPAGWKAIPGTMPPSLAATPFPLFWDADTCSFMTAIVGDVCLYELWRLDIRDTLVVSSLGIVTQPTPRFERQAAGFDVRRRNVVFGSAFDCLGDHEAPASSTDFLSVTR